MSTPISIPKLGVSMSEGTLVEWLVADGATVAAGDPLYRIHGEDPSDFSFAVEAAGEASGFIVDGA